MRSGGLFSGWDLGAACVSGMVEVEDGFTLVGFWGWGTPELGIAFQYAELVEASRMDWHNGCFMGDERMHNFDSSCL